MEKPIITISTKNFLTGIAPSAQIDNAGLFFKALGVTPVYDPGGTESVENGLLQAGPAPTDFTGSVIVDVPFAGFVDYVSDQPFLFMLGASGHLYIKAPGAATPIDMRSGTPITNPSNGIITFQPNGGSKKLYYFQRTQIGTWDMSGTYPTGWTDNAYTGLTTTLLHPAHKFYDRVYYGNARFVGSLKDDGAAGVTHTANDLDLPGSLNVTALSDDGVYLAIAVTNNLAGTDNFSDTRILFWDTNTSSWQREYAIDDPFIIALKRVGNVVYAFGQYGIFQCTFDGGVKKILARLVGFGTTADLASGYGSARADSFGQAALIFGTDASVDTLGKLALELKSAYYKPFKIPAAVGTPTLVNSSFDKGRVYVATDGPKLYAYDFDGATRNTGVSAQTVYFSLPTKYFINRIDVIFGEPLSSGDALDIDTKTDEDTAAVNFGPDIAFATQGAIRRISLYPTKRVQVDEQISLVVNLTGGNPKIKRIEVFGIPAESKTG